MALICKSCGAENARDAASCWKCEATGEALRGRATMPAAVWITATVVAIGGLGAGVWWGMLREGAPYAGLFNTASAPSAASQPASSQPAPTPSSPAAQPLTAATAGEAFLIADPVDGPFFVLFKQLLPEDYVAVVGGALARVPDPSANYAAFDAVLSTNLEAFQTRNAAAIARAESAVLAQLAANMQRALRTPEICRAAMSSDYQALPHGNLEARRIAAASNASLIRAVASGRPISAVRPPPADIATFQQELQARLPARLWPAYQSGQTGALPVEDQCAILGHNWGIIAGYPPEKAAQWTAWQMNPQPPAQ